MDSLFDRAVADALLARVERLTPDAERLWGTMTVSQMLAHVNVPFDAVYDPDYERAHPRPNRAVRALLRLVAKPTVVGERPYKRNMRTVPAFILTGEPDFDAERARLVAAINRVQAEGAAAFEGRESHSFGPLTAREWSTLFIKHTDHHLQQFGV